MGSRRRARPRPLPALILLTSIALGLLLALSGSQGWWQGPFGQEKAPQRTVASESAGNGAGVGIGEHDGGEETGGEVVGPQGSTDGLRTTVERGGVEQVATRLLCTYRDTGECVLASSGYLDLLGSVWGCVVEGDGWVEVCLVCEQSQDDTCKVSVLHMEPNEIAQVMGDGTEG